jgi:mono/diheme cytochrome c family protein
MLTIAAGLLVGFSLFVSLVVPRRNPEFPGRRVGLFVLAAALLVALMLGTVEVFGAEEEEGPEHAVETGAGPGAEPTTTGGTTGETTGGAPQGDVARGEQLFASEGCAGCHTLAAADATATVGPNLDELKPSFDAVVSQVTDGGGGMPPYGGRLSEDDIKAIAAYVVASTQ